MERELAHFAAGDTNGGTALVGQIGRAFQTGGLSSILMSTGLCSGRRFHSRIPTDEGISKHAVQRSGSHLQQQVRSPLGPSGQG